MVFLILFLLALLLLCWPCWQTAFLLMVVKWLPLLQTYVFLKFKSAYVLGGLYKGLEEQSDWMAQATGPALHQSREIIFYWLSLGLLF